MSEALRSRRSDVRYEPTFEQAPATAVGAGDPLAELARIVGHDDPFRSMIRNPAPPQAGHRPPAGPSSDADAFEGEHAEDGHGGYSRGEPSFFGDQGGVEGGAARLRPTLHEPADEGERYAEDHGYAEEHGYAEQEYAQSPDAYDPNAAEHEALGFDDGYHDGHSSDVDHPTEALSADAWANAGEVQPEARDHLSPSNEDAERRAAPRRPLVVLAAVLVLTGGGLAATFLARTGHAVGGTKDAPTILAASGPNKIKLADPAGGTPEDADAALLSRNGAAASGGPAKVVNSQEQPIDLAQLPKAAAKPSSGPMPAVSDGGPFPEPRKVKTFIVHPDATGFGGASRPAAPGAGTADASGAIGAALPPPTISADPPATSGPVPRPATPKTARAATTPKTTAEPTIADLAAAEIGPVAGSGVLPPHPRRSKAMTR